MTILLISLCIFVIYLIFRLPFINHNYSLYIRILCCLLFVLFPLFLFVLRSPWTTDCGLYSYSYSWKPPTYVNVAILMDRVMVKSRVYCIHFPPTLRWRKLILWFFLLRFNVRTHVIMICLRLFGRSVCRIVQCVIRMSSTYLSVCSVSSFSVMLGYRCSSKPWFPKWAVPPTRGCREWWRWVTPRALFTSLRLKWLQTRHWENGVTSSSPVHSSKNLYIYIYIYIYMAIQPFGPWPLFQLLNPIHSR
jgi:hypothetical protein